MAGQRWRYGLAIAAVMMSVPAWAACPALGPQADLNGARAFPAGDPWNRDISRDPVDPASGLMIGRSSPTARLHADFGAGYGLPYTVVNARQRRVPTRFNLYPAESDPGPYPIPLTAPIERGIDRHVLVVQRDASRPGCLGRLYELYEARREGLGWSASSGAVFDLLRPRQRPLRWTSADAAGLPIFPGLVRWDEVQRALRNGTGVVPHAFRFTLSPGSTRKGFVAPARHAAGAGFGRHLVPFGARVRLKASVPIRDHYPPEVKVILRTLKRYGMIMADNGGPWFVTGTDDPRWSNDALAWLGEAATGRSFEVLKLGPVIPQ